ncbi:hypothetical protein R5R35_004152 [Gryllus longicercus]|uniref:Uncharacterized protein n=1 Tax=Gryllus longicercus TaxID=2509291 RepID=A0AAN9VHB7_9ORTH
MTHMYTKSKINEICNLMDARWKTEEKIVQYRGLLTIFGRERKKEINEANKVRRQQAMKLKELRKDNLYFRQCLADSTYGNKQRIRNALQSNRKIQLCYQRLWPARVSEFFEHANNKKRKELDLLKYTKAKRMALFTSLKLEKAELQDRLDVGFENVKTRRAKQVITNRIEMFVVRQNAAAQVYKLYKNMLNLLHNDGHYFDAILVVLYSVCDEQCRCVLQAAELGQLASEDLNDIKEEYKWLEREVKVNMKERKREVMHIKKAAEELLLKCRLLTRAEAYSYAYNTSGLGSIFGSSSVIDRQTDDLEKIMNKIQEATLAPSYFDIFPRMLEQLHQEETLIKQMQKMRECKNRVTRMKIHSENLLDSLVQAVSSSSLAFQKKEEKLKYKMEEETDRLNREKVAIEDYVEMLANLKIGLQELYVTLQRLKEIPLAETVESVSDEVDEIALEEMTPEQIEETFPPVVEPNFKKLVSNISDKLAFYTIYAYETLDDMTLSEARVAHQTDMVYDRSSTLPIHEYDVPLLDEHEAEDAGVMTRAQLKEKSKQIVEEHRRILKMSELGP